MRLLFERTHRFTTRRATGQVSEADRGAVVLASYPTACAMMDCARPNTESFTRVRGMFDAAEAAFGGVDVLVNNAGIMPLSTIADTDDATFERLINVNLKGTFNTLREAAKRLREGGPRLAALAAIANSRRVIP
jgi:NAD(P)-dependent dehydrogenase (short-subunit alcohol dehydrogenase family)